MLVFDFVITIIIFDGYGEMNLTVQKKKPNKKTPKTPQKPQKKGYISLPASKIYSLQSCKILCKIYNHFVQLLLFPGFYSSTKYYLYDTSFRLYINWFHTRKNPNV